MIDAREVNMEIDRRELAKDLTWQEARNLAALYVIRANISPATPQTLEKTISQALNQSKKNGMHGESVFLRLVSEKNARSVWKIMDELMETLEVLNPRAYESIIKKIENCE